MPPPRLTAMRSTSSRDSVVRVSAGEREAYGALAGLGVREDSLGAPTSICSPESIWAASMSSASRESLLWSLSVLR